jgi:hypothetical protein
VISLNAAELPVSSTSNIEDSLMKTHPLSRRLSIRRLRGKGARAASPHRAFLRSDASRATVLRMRGGRESILSFERRSFRGLK